MNVTKEIRRYDGTWNRQAECVVGDEKGIVEFQATNDQLDAVKVGATITVRNALAKVMKETGRIKLIVDKWGKVEASQSKVSSVNHALNISSVEYVLVPTEGGNGQGGQRGGRGGRRGGRRGGPGGPGGRR